MNTHWLAASTYHYEHSCCVARLEKIESESDLRVHVEQYVFQCVGETKHRKADGKETCT